MDELKVKELGTLSYERPQVKQGYTDQTLRVDLSEGRIEVKPVPEEVKQKFIGGKGYDLWLLWQAVKPETKWNDPENALCIASGPLGGTPLYPGSGKSIVTTLSPLTGMVIDSNVGGYFGPYLKFSGFDALEVQGKSDRETVIFIDGVDQKVRLLEIAGLPAEAHEVCALLTAHFGADKPRSISVVCTGPGAGNTLFGCLNFSWYDARRKRARYKQAGRGGTGTVFADKGLKAIVARWDTVTLGSNNPADEAALKEVAKLHTSEVVELDPKQNEMARVGTTHLVTIMNDYDLLPTHNFRFGQHPEAPNMGAEAFRRIFDKGFDGCWLGCTVACSHGVRDFVPLTGAYRGRKVFVDGPEYETIAGCGSNLGIFDPYTVIEINFYCDTYGLDTISAGTAIAFAMDCYSLGLINREHTGGLDLNFGNRAAALELIHQMARGEGFGRIAGQGVRRMKRIFARDYGADEALLEDIGMEAKGLEFSEYMTKESLAQQGGYGLALKGPQHDEAWLIFLDMVHNLMPTFEQEGRGASLVPHVQDLVRAVRAVQAAVERRHSRGQQGDPRAGQGHEARGVVRPLLQRGHRARDGARGPDQHERGGLQLPAHLQPAHGFRPPRARPDPLPGHGAGDGGGVRVPPGALRQAVERRARGGGRGKEQRGKSPPAARLPGGDVRQASGCGLPAAGLDPGRRSDPGHGKAAGDRFPRGNRGAGGRRRQRMIRVGGKSIPWRQGMTVAELLEELGDDYPYAVVRIGGRSVTRPHFPETPVPDEAEVFLVPMIAGG